MPLMYGDEGGQDAFPDSQKYAEKFNDLRTAFKKKLQDSRKKGSKDGKSSASKIVKIAIAVLVGIIALLLICTNLITEVLWYNQTGFVNVLLTEYGMAILLGTIAFVLTFLLLFFSYKIAKSIKPTFQVPKKNAVLQQILAGARNVRAEKSLKIGLLIIVSLFFAISIGSQWTKFLLLVNSVPFNKVDPQFNLDISFYVFQLPAIDTIVMFLLRITTIGLIVTFLVHLSSGLITIDRTKKFPIKLADESRFQLGIYAAALCVIGAVMTFLSRYTSVYSSGSRITGASFVDVNAIIPGKVILSIILLVTAVLFIFAAVKGKWIYSVASIGILVASSLVILGILPVVVETFWVNPNAQEVESPYIARMMQATKDAFNLDDVDISQYNANTTATTGTLKKDSETAAQIRLLDPQIVSSTFKQLQQNKQYYNFLDTLAVDKYSLDNGDGTTTSHDTVIAVRDLDLTGNDQRNWINDHTVYTHGYGVVAAYGNQVNPDGSPMFYEKNIPTNGKLTDQQKYEARIYFSPGSPDYSIVGTDNPDSKWEFDFPTDNGDGAALTTFDGNGGPKVDNLLTRILYSIYFRSEQILFSSRVNGNSQILYVRNPAERVKKIAPYLILDGRVYPAVIDGRVKWIVDGYTTTDSYPYSELTDLSGNTTDSTTMRSTTIKALSDGKANYIKNSVKATVDAYDGSVDLYTWDTQDPILQAWSKIFPNTYKPLSDISGNLMSHIRYPEDLFKIQRSLLARYHVTSPEQFFSGEDFWKIPTDPTDQTTTVSSETGDVITANQPPYYLTLKMPGQNKPVFSLSSTFIPAGNNTRDILTGFLAVDSDAGNKKGVKGKKYGKMRLLELPKNSTVPGPGQAQNNFNSNAEVSKELNLLQSGSSKVTRGNLLTLPIGGGLIYVQPVYVQSSGTTSYPLLKKVLVSFGDSIGFADTLEEALNQTFNGNSGANLNSKEKEKVDKQRTLQDALQDARNALRDSEIALKNGDFAAYGEAQKRLKEAIEEATRLS